MQQAGILPVKRQIDPRFKLFTTDFSDLKQTAGTIRKICDSFNFDIIINNAGILSPPDLTVTSDGFEYTFQVNFLSHLLVNEIIIRSRVEDKPLISVAVTSPVYHVAKPGLSFTSSKKTYRPLKAYSESKLLLALMCKHYSELHKGSGMKFIAFNPGVFSSHIYRMQSQWFRVMYKTGAPFMVSARKVALILEKTLEREDLTDGSVYDLRGRSRTVPWMNESSDGDFWRECYRQIEQFL